MTECSAYIGDKMISLVLLAFGRERIEERLRRQLRSNSQIGDFVSNGPPSVVWRVAKVLEITSKASRRTSPIAKRAICR